MMITREEFNDWKKSEVTQKLVSNIDQDLRVAFENWKSKAYKDICDSNYVAGMAAALSDMKDVMLSGEGLDIEGNNLDD